MSVQQDYLRWLDEANSERNRLRTENAALRAQLEAARAQEPVAEAIRQFRNGNLEQTTVRWINPDIPHMSKLYTNAPDSAARIAELERELAARDLVIKQIREALAMSVSRDAAGRHNAAQQALAIQPTTAALDAARNGGAA